MKKNFCILILVALTMVGCLGANRKQAVAEAPERPMTAPVEEATLLPSPDGVVNVALIDGTRTMTIRKTAGQKVFVDFPTGGYTHLHAAVTPIEAGAANLRISAIVFPDGATDGPFGREVNHAIPAEGTVRIEIGENTMAGEPWGGDFTLDIRLSEVR